MKTEMMYVICRLQGDRLEIVLKYFVAFDCFVNAGLRWREGRDTAIDAR